MKLVYFVDYVHAQHAQGRTATGFGYVRDNYGPNADHNAIVKRADALESAGRITIRQGATPFGNPKYVYQPAAESPDEALDDELAEIIIQDVVHAYGGLRWSEIVKAAKETRPFRSAMQGDALDLSQDHHQAERLARLRATASDGRYASSEAVVSIDELPSKYGLDP